MYCAKCNNSVENCRCEDIDERLAEIANSDRFVTDRCKNCKRHPENCTCEEYEPLQSSD